MGRVWAKSGVVWAKNGGGLGQEWGSGQRMGGGLGNEGGTGQKRVASEWPCTLCGGGCKAYGVAGEPWRTWLGLRGRSGAGEGEQGGAGAAGDGRGVGPGLAGRGWGVGGRTCRCAGNVGNVSEKLQTFRSKERALIELVGKV